MKKKYIWVGVLFVLSFLAIASIVQTSITLTSSGEFNQSDDNLTASVVVSDISDYKVVYDWRSNNNEYSVFNVPLELDGSLNSTDYSYNNFTPTFVGTPIFDPTGGYDGYGGYVFDGLSEINYSVGNDLDYMTEVTVMAWVNRSVHAGSGSGIVCKTEDNKIGDWCLIESSSATTVVMRVNEGVGDANAYTDNLISDGELIHFTGTYDGQTVRLYKNGLEVANSTYEASLSNSRSELVIGGGYVDTRRFNGMIDEVKVFNKALSPEQIMLIYQNQTNLTLSDNTVAGDNWSVCANTFNTTDYSSQLCSDSITLLEEGESTCQYNGTMIITGSYCDFRDVVYFNSTYDNTSQYYYLELPDNYNPLDSHRLILYFHGAGSNATSSYRDMTTYNTFKTLAYYNDYIVASVDYAGRTYPQGWMNDAGKSDTAQILDNLTSTFNIDPEHIHTMGNSMGGMASLAFAIYDDRVDSATCMMGITNMTYFALDSASDPYKLTMESALGGTVAEVPEEYLEISAMDNIQSFVDIPVFLLYAENDSLVTTEEYGDPFYDLMTANNFYVDYNIKPNQTHNYNVVNGYEMEILSFMEYLDWEYSSESTTAGTTGSAGTTYMATAPEDIQWYQDFFDGGNSSLLKAFALFIVAIGAFSFLSDLKENKRSRRRRR
jgi:acetyl esterase/lipase